MTKENFKSLAKGKNGTIGYANGNTFEGVVVIKSKEMVIGGLHCNFTDIVKIDLNSCGIDFTTKNGFGHISL